MILIDLDNSYIDFVLTLSELSTTLAPEYQIVFQSLFSQSTFRLSLGSNLSANLNRYDYFKIPASGFTSMPDGEYSYKVIQTNSIPLTGNTIETGKAKVIAPAEDVQPFIYSPVESNNTYIYYSPNE